MGREGLEVKQHQLRLPYPATSGNHAVKHARGQHYLTADAKAYRALVAVAAHQAGLAGRRMRGPLRVHVLAAPPDERNRDADNVLKVMKDALTKAGVWNDDGNRVIRGVALDWAEAVAGGELLVTIEER